MNTFFFFYNYIGSFDNTIRLWNSNSGSCVKILKGHTGGVLSLVVLADSNLASGSYDFTIRIWNTKNGKYYLVLLKWPVLALMVKSDVLNLDFQSHIFRMKYLKSIFRTKTDSFFYNRLAINNCTNFELFFYVKILVFFDESLGIYVSEYVLLEYISLFTTTLLPSLLQALQKIE